ncbi:hypothetical protein [Planktothrix sp.]|jgi:hypothetical protein|uniref:hypothetical protein n=2 Tax=Planktothrix sp. TaxID=3088171 RepID=UPI0038D4CA07
MAIPSNNWVEQLQTCLELTKAVETHPEANQRFNELLTIIKTESHQMAELLNLIWQDLIAARRSASFWEQMSDVEKEMASNMMETMTQLRQNQLRLIQEM